MRIFLSAALAGLVAIPAHAASVGLPIFTTAPSTVNITAEFIENEPIGAYSFTVNSIIATAQGAPELVGLPIYFNFFFKAGLGPSYPTSQSLAIGDDDIFIQLLNQDFDDDGIIDNEFAGASEDLFIAYFPDASAFSGFGVNPVLQYSFAFPLPIVPRYYYCNSGTDFEDCFYDLDPALTEVNGQAVEIFQTIEQPEGTIENAVVTFSTVGGRPVDPVAPIPLPAAAPLLLGALGLLGATARRTRRGAVIA